MYKGWLIPSDFTPSGPDDLTVYVDVRSNMKGDLEPVIVAEWKAKDDGGLLMHFHIIPICYIMWKSIYLDNFWEKNHF